MATGASCAEMLEQVLQAAESRAEVRAEDISSIYYFCMLPIVEDLVLHIGGFLELLPHGPESK